MVSPCELTGGSARKNVLSEQPNSSVSDQKAGQSLLRVGSKVTSGTGPRAPRVPGTPAGLWRARGGRNVLSQDNSAVLRQNRRGRGVRADTDGFPGRSERFARRARSSP